ncbi:MAG: hypothetical protein RM338_26095 [Nostoc sp. DedQUE12a]|nr:hypothetical protein [Nostoc sp. DedQUE12a]
MPRRVGAIEIGHWALGIPGSVGGVGGWGRNLSPHTSLFPLLPYPCAPHLPIP